jgi:hypothetical protein
MPSFPVSPDQLTTDWLSVTLGYQVDGLEIVFFSEGTGVMSWVMRILLDTADDKPNSLIAKFPSSSAVNREGAKRYNMYGREVNFYQEIAADVKIYTPECYFSAFDPVSNQFIILLEDLTSWQIGDQVSGCTLAEAKSVITALARFHASGWQPTHYPDLPSHGGAQQTEGMQATYPIGWPVVIEQFGDLIPESVRAAGEKVPQYIPSLLARMCQEPVCITHADLRLDNIFFKDGEIALVDWQSTCTSSPEQDLAYFLTQSVPASVRQQEDLVAWYHRELTEQGISYDLSQCRERYTVSTLYLVCYAVVIAGTLDLGNERGRELGQTIIKNTFGALTELDAFSLIPD